MTKSTPTQKLERENYALEKSSRPLIVHLIYCLSTGGLERVMANCIRQLTDQPFRHVVISLTNTSDFAKELPADVAVFCLNKKPGADLWIHLKLWRLLRKLKPTVLHSYNLATLEYHPVAWLAGVSGHLHAEHGRDISDLHGKVIKYQRLRRWISPFLNTFVSVSADLQQWLHNVVKIKANKNQLIYNGVNTEKFQPVNYQNDIFTFIHVARLAPIKNQQMLIAAAALLQQQDQSPWQLCLVGDGPAMDDLQTLSQQAGLSPDRVRFLGERKDIAQLMAQSHVFVMSSISEGVPMTILEAMACGLPVVATAVGGIPELISSNEGILVNPQDTAGLACAMHTYLQNPKKQQEHGQAARARVCQKFSEHSMVAQYAAWYQKLSQ